jgi:transcriptional regulator with XRE-family HTH domain
MVLFRRLLGDVLRRHRQRQGRTLRDVAASARISLGYLSEVERGRKEASSELLASLCEALDISLADVLGEVSHDIAVLERRSLTPVGFTPATQHAPTAQLTTSRLANRPAAVRPKVSATLATQLVNPAVKNRAVTDSAVAATRMPVAAA